VTDDFLRGLASSLDAVGVRGSAARRVLLEARDHLEEAARDGEEDPARQFGDPQQVARLVAAELATGGTRRATFTSFGALALTGLGYVAVFALVPAAGGWTDLFGGRVAGAAPVLALGVALLPQIAFVAGTLALLRAFRMDRTPEAGAAELRLLRHQNWVALGAAGGTIAAVAAYALDAQGDLASWWVWATLGLCLALAPLLVVAGVRVARAGAPMAAPGAAAGDVFDDLDSIMRIAPLRRLGLPAHPWRFALLGAAAVGAVGFAGGWYAEGDPGSGLVRGGFEAVALVICFAALGRTLGLRRTKM